MTEYRAYWTTKCGQKFENYIEADDNDLGLGHALLALIPRTDGKRCENCVELVRWGRGGKGIEKDVGVFCVARGLPIEVTMTNNDIIS